MNRSQRRCGTNSASRDCGECSACCTVLGIEKLNKPPGVPCPMLLGRKLNRCGCYRNRPGLCRQFHCGWKQGLGDLGDRPDKLGLVVAGRMHLVVGSVLIINEVWGGASATERAAEVLGELGGRTGVVVHGPSGQVLRTLGRNARLIEQSYLAEMASHGRVRFASPSSSGRWGGGR